MTFNPVVVAAHVEKPHWYRDTAKYASHNTRLAIWQLVSTLIPYVLLASLMGYMILQGYSYWVVLVPALPAAALYVRIFILFHDCTHGSFLSSPRWNTRIGYLCGVITFTAFYDWRRSHAGHHITVGDLDRRGMGDVTTMTVEEYQAAPTMTRVY